MDENEEPILLNVGILLLIPLVITEFMVFGLPAALLGSLVLSAINTIIIIVVLDDDSFFQHHIRRLLLDKAAKEEVPQTRGVVVVQIDGQADRFILGKDGAS